MLACRDTAAVAQAANVAAAVPILLTVMLTPSEGEAEPAVATVIREPGRDEDVDAPCAGADTGHCWQWRK